MVIETNLNVQAFANNYQAKVDENANAQAQVNSNAVDKTPEKDTVHLSKAKKFGIAYVAGSLILTGMSLAYMIGRNPAKAAKVLKGNNNIVNKAYEEGNKLAENILHKKGEFKTTINTILETVFKKPEYKTAMHQDIAQIEELLKKNNVQMDKDTEKSFKILKQNLEQYCTNIEQSLGNGTSVKTAQEFIKNNKGDLDTIGEFLRKQNSSEFIGLSYNFDTLSSEGRVGLIPHISECPTNLLPNNGTFFHGTKNAKAVYKNGFTPYVSNQLDTASRELGAGIYVTPDVRVAASFSGLNGNIIPVSLSKDAKIALINENSSKILHEQASALVAERMSKEEFKKLPKDVQNAMQESIVQHIFKEAGYDAVYSPKGLKTGGGVFDFMNPNINDVIGTNQSQVAIFSPEKLEITSRSFKERLGDLKEKYSALKALMQYQKEHPSAV